MIEWLYETASIPLPALAGCPSTLSRFDGHCARPVAVGAAVLALLLTSCGLDPDRPASASSADSGEPAARAEMEFVTTRRAIPQPMYRARQPGKYGWPSPILVAADNPPMLAWNTADEASIPRVIDVPDELSKTDLYNLKAETFYNDGERQRAIRIWELNLQRRPNHLPSLNNLAKAYLNVNRFKAAAERFETLIGNDAVGKSYVQARFLGPWAYYKQYSRLSPRHADYLYDYLNSTDPVYRKQAEVLFRIAKDPVVSEPVNRRLVERMQADLVHSKRNIVHFWAEWCRPCLKELTDLFRFRSDHPDIQFWVVSVDAEGDKERADRRLNELFAPFKNGPNTTIRFVHDPGKRLWRRFIPKKDQAAGTVPKTVLLKGRQTVGYIPLKADWMTLDPARYWRGTIEPGATSSIVPPTTPLK